MGQTGLKNQSPSHAADPSPLIYRAAHPQEAIWVSSVSCSSKLWTLSCWLWEMFHTGQKDVVKLGSLLNCGMIKDAPDVAETADKLNLKMGTYSFLCLAKVDDPRPRHQQVQHPHMEQLSRRRQALLHGAGGRERECLILRPSVQHRLQGDER